MLDWLGGILRTIFLMLDKVVYGFVGIVYNLLTDIAETSIFTEEIFDAFASKIYALLGVFMLFKVSFSIITYIVNPDDFTDKNKGFSKLITNIIITLTLLITTPWIFNQAMDIQRIILRDNIIGKVFVGVSGNNSSITNDSNPGMVMAYDTLSAFYTIDYTMYDKCIGINKTDNFLNDDCKNKAFGGDENFPEYARTLRHAQATKSIDIYLDSSLAGAKDSSGNYTMTYIPLLSTACGVVILLLLVVFCFDVALRSIKLGFLRMIAPIPIISRVDPKKGKEIFDKWVKTTMSTYLDLFIRLLAIYFAIFVITNVSNMQFVDAVTGLRKEVNPFVVVFIILGALMFAKQLPKLIEDITGIKMSGNFTLNPLKKLSEVPLLGKPMTDVAKLGGRSAMALGGVAAGYAGGKMSNLGKKAGSWIDDKTGNRISGAAGAFGSWRSNSSESFRRQFPHLSSELSGIGADAQKTMYGVTGGIFNGGKAAEELDAKIKEFDDVSGNIDSILKRANSEMIKYESVGFTDDAGNSVTMRDFKLAKENLAAMRNVDTSRMGDRERSAHIQQINDLQTSVAKSEKLAEQAYVDAVKAGTVSDSETTARLGSLERSIASSRDVTIRAIDSSTGAGLKAGKDTISDEKATIQQSEDYARAQAKKAAMPPKKDKK